MSKRFPTRLAAIYQNKFLIAIVLLMIAIIIVPIPAYAGPPTERVFRVEASRFAYSPSILSVNPGDRVVIELVAKDVVHGLAIDGYSLEVTGDPGQTARLTFVANRSGSYRFRCSTTCGGMHPFMIGKLQVGRDTFFWRGAALTALLTAGIALRRK
jgi:heme/copper-type cytochrome/quinol oxidase subunit 2